MRRLNPVYRLAPLPICILLLLSPFLMTTFTSTRISPRDVEVPAVGGTRGETTNLTVTYNRTHLFFYIDVVNDKTTWPPDNMDSVAIFIDGDADGAVKDFDAPRGSVRDFGMIAFPGMDFQPFEYDRFGYLVRDSGSEERDRDARIDNLMIDAMNDNGTYRCTFLPGMRDNHRIYEIEINASYYGLELAGDTVMNVFLRVTNMDDLTGNIYTAGALYGGSTDPEDMDWYEVDFSNPGGQELTLTDITGNEPVINGTIWPGEWPATIMNITEKDALPSRENWLIFYPDNDNGVMADNSSVAKLIFTVRDPDEYSVTEVMANLSEINYPLPVEMKDDGTGGDAVADDHNFTLEFTIPRGVVPGGYEIFIHIFDHFGNHRDSMVERVFITVKSVNRPPVVNASAPGFVYLYEDSSPIFIDPGDLFRDNEGDTLEYRITDRNNSWGIKFESENLTCDFIVNQTFRVRVRPNVYMEEGIFDTITFRATDPIGSVLHMINFTIMSRNDAPVIYSMRSTVKANEDSPTVITIKARDDFDPEDTLTISTDFEESIPSMEVNITTSSGTDGNNYVFDMAFTPTNDLVGEYLINVTIYDDDAASEVSEPTALDTNFTLIIENVNDPPFILSMKMRGGMEKNIDAGQVTFDIDEDETVEVLVTATDPDFIHGTESLAFSLVGHDPDTASITKENDTTARIEYTPVPDYNGEENFGIRVSDGDVDVTEYIEFSIIPENDEPVIIHWEIWTVSVDEDTSSPEIENLTYSFYIRDRAEKAYVEKGSVRDVDGDIVKFGWIIYKVEDVVAWEWDLADFNGTNITDYEFPSEGDYKVVLMCNDNNGSFQVIGSIDLKVKQPDNLDEKVQYKEEKVEIPYLIIILCLLFLIGLIILVVFVTSRATYLKMEKESRTRAQEERMNIQKVVDKYDLERARFREEYIETEIYQGDFEAEFFGLTEKESAEAAQASAPEIVEETQSGAAIFEAARMKDQQSLPISGPDGIPMLPPSPPPEGGLPQPGMGAAGTFPLLPQGPPALPGSIPPVAGGMSPSPPPGMPRPTFPPGIPGTAPPPGSPSMQPPVQSGISPVPGPDGNRPPAPSD